MKKVNEAQALISAAVNVGWCQDTIRHASFSAKVQATMPHLQQNNYAHKFTL